MPPGFPPVGFPGAPFGFPQPPQPDAAAYQPQEQYYQQEYQQGNGGTKRPRDEGNNNNNNQGGQGKKHKANLAINRPLPHKVLPCRFYQKGACNKGDNCTYVHDVNM